MMALRTAPMARAMPAVVGRRFAVRVQAVAKAGDKLPDVTVFENDTNTSSKLTDIFKGKKGVLVGIPGAYTPTCSSTHVPSYIQKIDELKKKGADVVAIIAVNDPFVMGAWGEHLGGSQKGIRFLADVQAQTAKALGLDTDMTDKLGGVRIKRFSAIINDNTITHMNLESEEDNSSYADKALTQL